MDMDFWWIAGWIVAALEFGLFVGFIASEHYKSK